MVGAACPTPGSVQSTVKIAHNLNGGPALPDFSSFGFSATEIGDLNRDGTPDLAVGTPTDDIGGGDRGALDVLLMNSDGTVSSSVKIAHNLNGGPALADDDNFGSLTVDGSTPITHTFTISNSGTADLTLTGSPAVTLTTATAFTITQPFSTTVGAGEITIFTITFNPPISAGFTDTVSIANNDSDENPYTFVISGTGITAGSDVYLPLIIKN